MVNVVKYTIHGSYGPYLTNLVWLLALPRCFQDLQGDPGWWVIVYLQFRFWWIHTHENKRCNRTAPWIPWSILDTKWMPASFLGKAFMLKLGLQILRDTMHHWNCQLLADCTQKGSLPSFWCFLWDYLISSFSEKNASRKWSCLQTSCFPTVHHDLEVYFGSLGRQLSDGRQWELAPKRCQNCSHVYYLKSRW